MRDPEHIAALFENILEHVGGMYSTMHNALQVYGQHTTFCSDEYNIVRKRIIDLMVEIELGNIPDWDQINSILPTLEG